MGAAIDMMIWYYSLIFFFSGFALAYALLLLLRRLWPHGHLLQRMLRLYPTTYVVSAVLFWAFQLYHLLPGSYYLQVLLDEIPRSPTLTGMLLLSILPLLGLAKKVRQQLWMALTANLLLLFLCIVHQLYPFVQVDKAMLWEVGKVILKSTLWFIALSLVLVYITYAWRLQQKWLKAHFSTKRY